jgi:hypothetical protein
LFVALVLWKMPRGLLPMRFAVEIEKTVSQVIAEEDVPVAGAGLVFVS